jgi:cytochrome c-type biogenesis protein CcmH/NrfG
MAKSSLDFDAEGSNPKQKEYTALAESSYKRALELEPTNTRALYGLSVLYAFELDQGEKAIPLLEKLLTIDTKNIDAMFVLARAYYMDYDFQKAVDMYDSIIKYTSSETSRAEAEANKKVVLNALYSE